MEIAICTSVQRPSLTTWWVHTSVSPALLHKVVFSAKDKQSVAKNALKCALEGNSVRPEQVLAPHKEINTHRENRDVRGWKGEWSWEADLPSAGNPTITGGGVWSLSHANPGLAFDQISHPSVITICNRITQISLLVSRAGKETSFACIRILHHHLRRWSWSDSTRLLVKQSHGLPGSSLPQWFSHLGFIMPALNKVLADCGKNASFLKDQLRRSPLMMPDR